MSDHLPPFPTFACLASTYVCDFICNVSLYVSTYNRTFGMKYSTNYFEISCFLVTVTVLLQKYFPVHALLIPYSVNLKKIYILFSQRVVTMTVSLMKATEELDVQSTAILPWPRPISSDLRSWAGSGLVSTWMGALHVENISWPRMIKHNDSSLCWEELQNLHNCFTRALCAISCCSMAFNFSSILASSRMSCFILMSRFDMAVIGSSGFAILLAIQYLTNSGTSMKKHKQRSS